MRSRRAALGITMMVSALVTAPVIAPVGVAAETGNKTASAQQGKVLRIGVTQDIDSLNPFISITRTGTDILRTAFDYLTVYSQEDQTPEPSLAESWDTSEDKLTWTFHLRTDAKWSDGKPLTAADPEFTYNKMMTDETAATANGSYVKEFKTVKATDEHTLVITTKTPQATMTALDIPIVPKHIWEKMPDIGAVPAFPMVGSGPYYVSEFVEGQYTKMKANPHFWRGKAKVDEIQFVYFRNPDAAVTALRNNQLDLINRLNPQQFDALKSDPNIALNKAKGKRFNEILINPGASTSKNEPIGDGNPALKDPKLRTAIAMAIDSKTIVDKVFGGYGETAKGYIPPLFSTYTWTPPADQLRTFDIKGANKLLDEAGYKRGTDGVRVDKQGKPLNLRLLAHAGTTLDEGTTPYIVGWLNQVGIKVSPEPVSDDQVNEDTTRGDFDLAFSGWNTNPDPDYVLSLQTCKNRPNAQGKGATPDSFLCDPEYDKLYQQQLSEFDQEKRAEIVKRMQEIINEKATLVLLGYDDMLEAYRKDTFEGFPLQPASGGVIMNQQGYWGYYGATPKGMGPVKGFGKTDNPGQTSEASAEGDGGGNTGLILGIIGGVLVVVVVVGLFVARSRRKPAEERE